MLAPSPYRSQPFQRYQSLLHRIQLVFNFRRNLFGFSAPLHHGNPAALAAALLVCLEFERFTCCRIGGLLKKQTRRPAKSAKRSDRGIMTELG